MQTNGQYELVKRIDENLNEVKKYIRKSLEGHIGDIKRLGRREVKKMVKDRLVEIGARKRGLRFKVTGGPVEFTIVPWNAYTMLCMLGEVPPVLKARGEGYTMEDGTRVQAKGGKVIIIPVCPVKWISVKLYVEDKIKGGEE